MKTSLFFSREILGLYLDLQLVIALNSPEHLEHLRSERGKEEFTVQELLEHFAGIKDIHGGGYARKYREMFVANWEDINSDLNRYGAGKWFGHNPSIFEAALYFFATTGLFRLEKNLISQMIDVTIQAKQKSLANIS